MAVSMRTITEKNVEDKLLEDLRSKPNFDPHNTEGMCMTYFD